MQPNQSKSGDWTITKGKSPFPQPVLPAAAVRGIRKQEYRAPKARLTRRVDVGVREISLNPPEQLSPPNTGEQPIIPPYAQALVDALWHKTTACQITLGGDPMATTPDSASIAPRLSRLRIRDFSDYEKQWLADTSVNYKKLVSVDSYGSIVPDDPLTTSERIWEDGSPMMGGLVSAIGSIPSGIKSWWDSQSEDDKLGWEVIAAAIGIPLAVLLGKGILKKYGTKLWIGHQISKLTGNGDDGVTILNQALSPAEQNDLKTMAGVTTQPGHELLAANGVGPAQAAALGSMVGSVVPIDDSLVSTNFSPSSEVRHAVSTDVIAAAMDVGNSIQHRLDGSAAFRSFPTIGAPYELLTRRIPNKFFDPEFGIIPSAAPYLPTLATEPALSGGKLKNALSKAKNFLKNTKVGQMVSTAAKTVIGVMPGGALINKGLEIGSKFIPDSTEDEVPQGSESPAVIEPGQAAQRIMTNPSGELPTTMVQPILNETNPINEQMNTVNLDQLPPGWNVVMEGAPAINQSADQNDIENAAKATKATGATMNDDVLEGFRPRLCKYSVFCKAVQDAPITYPPTRAAVRLLEACSATAIRDAKKFKLTTSFTDAVMNYIAMLKKVFKENRSVLMHQDLAAGLHPVSQFIFEATTQGTLQFYLLKYYVGLGIIDRGGAVGSAKSKFESTFKTFLTNSVNNIYFTNILQAFDKYTKWFNTESGIAPVAEEIGYQMVMWYAYLVGTAGEKVTSKFAAAMAGMMNAALDSKVENMVGSNSASWSEAKDTLVIRGSSDKNKAIATVVERENVVRDVVEEAASANSFVSEDGLKNLPKRAMPGESFDANGGDDAKTFADDEKGSHTDPDMPGSSDAGSMTPEQVAEATAQEGLDPKEDGKLLTKYAAEIAAASPYVEDKTSWSQWEKALGIVGASASVIALLMPVLKRLISGKSAENLTKLIALGEENDGSLPSKASAMIPIVYGDE